jgi:putative phage-type endonuclease
MIELQVQQGTPEWHAVRAKCFNASEAPAMMGVSPYMTRPELLRQKATGIVPEVDAETQRRFDAGHEAEANARPHVEGMIGEELYPIVATDDAGRLLASSDGATMLCNIGFEHKLWNEKIAAEVEGGSVPESHRWQLDQQFAVFGFDKIAFVCSDGTPEKFTYCWYYPQPDRIARLRAGWEQFEKDLAEYQHVDVVAKPVAEKVEGLPALFVQVEGRVVASNMDAFKGAAELFLSRLPKADQLKSDQDFANADQAAKDCNDAEDRLQVVKAQAQSQATSIDEVFRAIDSISDKIRTARLSLEKVVKAEKENRKNEIVSAASKAMYDHIVALHERVGVQFKPEVTSFADSIKGLKSLDSMRDKVSVALANAKIEANAVADRIDANRKAMGEHSALFPDFSQVCTKAPDDFAALVAVRVAAKKEADEKLLAEQREKIRAELEDSGIRAAQEVGMAAIEAIKTGTGVVKITAGESGVSVQHIHTGQVIDTGKTIKIGEICALLGFTVTADFLSALGFDAVAHNKNAKLYYESSFKGICAGISAHVLNVGSKPMKEAA